MLLRNFKNMQAAIQMHSLLENAGTHFEDGYLTFKRYNGGIFNCCSTSAAARQYSLAQACDSPGVAPGSKVFGLMPGSGDAAVSYDDYTITAFSGLLHISTGCSFVYNSANKKWELTGYHVIQNNGAASITVKEVGLFGYGHYAGSAAYYYETLYAREVLSTPLTVPVGGYFNISMSLALDVTDPTA